MRAVFLCRKGGGRKTNKVGVKPAEVGGTLFLGRGVWKLQCSWGPISISVQCALDFTDAKGHRE